MKANIHPTWNHAAQVVCACGSTFTTGSSQDTIHVDICSACHPFFTGEMKFVDRQGRVDRFMQKMSAAQAKQAAMQAKQGAKAAAKKAQAEAQAATPNGPVSYKQMLQQEQTRLKQQSKATA